MIEILSNGAPNLIQDMGRRGHLGIGVSRGGAMDTVALSHANALVRNDAGAAAIEISLFPFRARFLADTQFSVTGADCVVRLDEEVMAPWWSRQARAGQTLLVERPRRGARAYVAFKGGIDVKPVMGSRSTDLKGAFGGYEGRGLRRGDILKLNEREGALISNAGLGIVPKDLPTFWQELSSGLVAVRAIPAAEYELFTDDARQVFVRTDYEITPDANRVGYRLKGASLPLRRPLELLSHGIVAGTVQVPPSGQPIIQLAEANTCGGYPKIATVIEADLWKLAQAPIGCRIRFVLTDVASAVATLRVRAIETRRMYQTLEHIGQRA
ncbi:MULTISPECIES: biotin-dependent carboxyltransferase family protein [Paraburkholderia]|uniref:5-oxoprolinase subunit C family protein n=1 Tax=Paraburkholderia TaxID=1822464 RepID=UPI0006B6042C|nr:MULTISPECIES: biotin-dependent carboxyltransferase family protein [Paraburkholderia]KPD15757.1 allophanate hydrolase [Burkholderia sp. ST111]MBK5153487.1 biotin-dependent carboxyltransferase family protein [Burkholderia sp. R-69608]MBK5185574.1 biotin-dependent carboxyltransferase family protein [Burkholderia sp. R-69749]CAE6881233.1 5-oxoprolinase subunit C [Paraburkholderia domus]CAE6972306.1 5-oxoprolinase subunit C [Paraburkholderia nemoris]